MPLPDIFDPAVTAQLIRRIESVSQATKPAWGKMNAAQMLAHCCVVYRQIRGEIGAGPWLLRTLARTFFKKSVVGDEPFKQNLPTAKAFIIRNPQEFARERERLITYVREIHAEGAAAFEGRTSLTWGPMSAREWSNLLYKHLDHHLRQFSA
jgi:Protein of unknown function (DUF1569)